MDLIDRINANYNNLSRVHKRIVDYITDNPDRACFQSLKDFSDSVSAGMNASRARSVVEKLVA